MYIKSLGANPRQIGIFNTAYNLSTVLAPHMAGWLYNSRLDLSFLVSVATIPVMMGLSFALLRGDMG